MSEAENKSVFDMEPDEAEEARLDAIADAELAAGQGVPHAKVVEWLQHFEPKNGKSFVYAEFPDVCPNRGLRLVQPAVAENAHP